ncbi:MAG: Regulatory sensor-transducer, BlaR1/MecR1 family [Gemmataceae bacterium]|nr:Regulatory sensor-transducer, BlaR1/MecR1 family [Gemmataceae bacterium]
MTDLAADWVGVLADWSVRWGVLILGLMAILTTGRPRSVAGRLWLARLVLVGGLFLPLLPTWWTVPLPTVVRVEAVADRSSAEGSGRVPHLSSVQPPPEAQPAAPVPPVSDPVLRPGPDEPALAPPSAITWPVVLAAAWLAGCGGSLFRLAAGRWWLARVRAAARPIDGGLLAEFTAVRAELGVRRPVVFLTSSAVAGPALFGGRRPAVVVPPDWAALPAADRRAVLLHELAHVAHADDWSGLAEEFVRAVFFFHPLVRQLVARLAFERELRCDATAVRQNVTSSHLARVLLDGARRLGPGRAVLTPAGATPMFHRNAVKDRIHQLLEADMTRWSKPLSPARAALTAVAVLGCCAGLAGIGAKAGPPADSPPATPGTAPDRKPAPGVQGTVTGPDGKSVAGATVLAVGDAGWGERMRTTSDAAGRFSFGTMPVGKSAYPGVLLVAGRDGFAAADTFWSPAQMGAVELKLSRVAPFSGTVKDAAGRPVAGAEVQAGFVHRSGEDPGLGRFACCAWGYVPAVAVRGTSAEPFYLAKTDSAGRFRFASLPAGDERIFRVMAKGFAELDTGAGGPVEGKHTLGADALPAEFVLQPEAVIRGRVVSRVPRVKPDTAKILIQGRDRLHGFSQTVQPDADGRFTAAGLPAGPIGVGIDLPSDAPATARDILVTTEPGGSKDISLEVVPGVEVSGRLQYHGTGKPAAGAHLSMIRLVHSQGMVGGKPADADGRFQMRLPPGKVQLHAYKVRTGNAVAVQSPVREIEVPSDAARYALPKPFELVEMIPPPLAAPPKNR